MTYKELLEKLQGLNPAQLSQQVWVSKLDEPTFAVDLDIIEADLYDSGCGYVASKEDLVADDEPMTDEEFSAEYGSPVYHKGDLFLEEIERVCRVCGCTDAQGCLGGCCWVEEDLCSSCARGNGVVDNGTAKK